MTENLVGKALMDEAVLRMTVAQMVLDHAILSVLKPARPGGKALVSIDMELLPEQLSELQSFLAGPR